MPPFEPKNWPEVENLFKADPLFSDCESHCGDSRLEFQLAQCATGLTRNELSTCLDLIEETSGDDYKASSIGWNRKEKLKEMMDQDMMYLLIRQGSPVLKRRWSAVEDPSDPTGRAQDTMPRTYSNSTAQTQEKEIERPESNDLGTLGSKQAGTSSSQSSMPGADCNKDKGRILGFISFMSTSDDPPYENREVLYIYEIHMKDSLRGRGLGSKLISFVEKAAVRCGISKTMLTVFAVNEKARRLYEKLGYNKDDCSPKDRMTRTRIIKADYVIMSKELAL